MIGYSINFTYQFNTRFKKESNANNIHVFWNHNQDVLCSQRT